MKRHFTITVDIDTEQSDQCRLEIYPDGNYRIRVADDPIVSGCAPESMFAHEIGHLIGREFAFPRTVADPRCPSLNLSSRGQYYQRIVESEEEAWDIAESLFMTKLARERSLATYKNFVAMFKVIE